MSGFRFRRREPSAWGYVRYLFWAILGGFIVAFLWATWLLGSWREIGQPLIFCLSFSLPVGVVLMYLQWLANGERNTMLERSGDAISGLVIGLILAAVIALIAGYTAGGFSDKVTDRWGGAVQGNVTVTDPEYAVDAMLWLGKGLIPVGAILGAILAAVRGRPGHMTDAFFQR